jgi:methionine synthase I (cobalamin-dependent)
VPIKIRKAVENALKPNAGLPDVVGKRALAPKKPEQRQTD